MNISELDNYKDAYKIYNLLKVKNHPNIILYSNKNVDKTILIKTIMNNIFNCKNIHVNEDLKYEYNDYYYYFNLINIKYSQKKLFTSTIESIINSYNFYTNQYNYIIFDNFNDINILFENYLKVIIENSLTTKFIILTNKINKVIQPIRSRCLCIRLSEINIYDKEIYIHTLLKKNCMDRSKVKIHDLLQFDNKAIKKNLEHDFINFDIFIFKRILNFFDKPLNKNLIELKDLSYNIKNSLIDFSELCIKIIKHFSIQNITNEKKTFIVKEITEMNYLMINCYKDIIFIETLLLSLYKIINE